MCGQEGSFGTNSFQLLLDINKIQTLDSKNLEEKINIDSFLEGENPDDPCSKQNIEIKTTTTYVPSTNMGEVDDEYDPGF